MREMLIGEIVNTHGIKGELRVQSDFEPKEVLYQMGKTFYIGKQKEPVVLTRYRTHKGFDMVTFEGLDDINEVLPFKGELLYVDRETLEPGIYPEDYLGLNAYVSGKSIGKVVSLQKSKAHDLFEIIGENHYFVPKLNSFIEKVDLDNHEIHFIEMKGLFDEN